MNLLPNKKYKQNRRAKHTAMEFEKNINSAFNFHNMDDNDHDVNCIDCYESKSQSHLKHTNMRNNIIPINIDIEYSFSPKLLIKSVNTIIDNYENVNESDSKGRYVKIEASSSNSARKTLNENKENKSTHISKIFDAIFKSPNYEFDSAIFQNNDVAINATPLTKFGGVYNYNNNCQLYNKNIVPIRNHHHRSQYSFNCCNRTNNISQTHRDRHACENILNERNNNYHDVICRQNLNVNVNNFQHNNDDKIFKIEKIVKFQNKTKLFESENVTIIDSEDQEDKNIENRNLIAEIGNPYQNFSRKISDGSVNSISIPNNSKNIRKTTRLVNMVNKFNQNYSLLKSNLLHLSNHKIKSYLDQSISNYDDKSHKFFCDSKRLKYSFDYDDNEIHLTKSKGRRARFKYKMYSREEKEFCIELIMNKMHNLVDVANCCEVPLKSLKRWLKVGCERKKGGGRKVKDPELEGKLINWYDDLIAKGLKPKYGMIRDKALKMTKSKNFMASKGWFEKFKKKYNLKFGRKLDLESSI